MIDNEVAALVLLLAAAAGAVAFSLRYASEWTTAFAFLLIYAALALAAWKTAAQFNLAATTIIAAGLALLVWRLAWDRLLMLGALATWAVLGTWVVVSTSLIEPSICK